MKNKITLINMISTLFLQIVTILSGFIIPRIILSYFGSEVNGLVSSLTQFLSYITIIEGGITGVILASLYKPLVENDNDKISSIIATTNKFYKKIGLIFIIYSLFIAIVYPVIFDKTFSWSYSFLLTLILSISLLIQYMFSLSLRNLLMATKKIYIVSITQTIIIILSIVLAYLSVKIYPNIHLLKFLMGVLYILQPIVYNWYIKKHFHLKKDTTIDNNLIKSRWDGFAINIAAFIHGSTDITILTIFTNLSTVSIYGVYSLVTSGLKQMINSLTTPLNPIIGQAYAMGDTDELNKKLDIYEYIVLFLVFLIFTTAIFLISPFVMIYTKGINDANYYQPTFGVLLLLSEAVYLLKYPHLNLAYSANKFKKITKPAYIEALINIVLSCILVWFYGLIGVVIGTLIAMTYRLIEQVNYTKELIPSRVNSIFYKKLFCFILFTSVGVLIFAFIIPPVQFSVSSWLVHGIIYMMVLICLYLLMSLLFFKKELLFFKNYLMRHK